MDLGKVRKRHLLLLEVAAWGHWLAELVLSSGPPHSVMWGTAYRGAGWLHLLCARALTCIITLLYTIIPILWVRNLRPRGINIIPYRPNTYTCTHTYTPKYPKVTQ